MAKGHIRWRVKQEFLRAWLLHLDDGLSELGSESLDHDDWSELESDWWTLELMMLCLELGRVHLLEVEELV